jgi:hypothetical protein
MCRYACALGEVRISPPQAESNQGTHFKQTTLVMDIKGLPAGHRVVILRGLDFVQMLTECCQGITTSINVRTVFLILDSQNIGVPEARLLLPKGQETHLVRAEIPGQPRQSMSHGVQVATNGLMVNALQARPKPYQLAP